MYIVKRQKMDDEKYLPFALNSDYNSLAFNCQIFKGKIEINIISCSFIIDFLSLIPISTIISKISPL
jgi:hypothetical protein